ncbi:MAG: S8 family serine peptidase [Pseudomonadota bacterium]
MPTIRYLYISACLMAIAVTWGGQARAADYAPHQLLVKFRAQTTAQVAGGIYRRHAPKSVKPVAHFGIEKWEISPDVTVDSAIAELQKDPSVEYVEPNYRRRAFGATSNAEINWYDQVAYTQLNIKSAWDFAQVTNPKPVVVAIFDSAIDINNPDLKPYLWTSSTNSNQHGWDTINGDSDPSPGRCVDPHTGKPETDQDLDHGTWVTSVIAGMLKHINPAVATPATPAPKISLMGIRMGCYFLVSDELEAVDFAVRNGANVINASYGGIQYSSAERDGFAQLASKNILLITAAGNNDGDNDRIPNYPANLDLPNVIAVGATEGVSAIDRLTYWSHYGATSVDLAAPGDAVWVSQSTAGEFSYAEKAGTSFSAPLVSGVAALLMSALPDSVSSQAGIAARLVRASLEGGVVPLKDKGFLATDGRVDALGAMQFLYDPTPMIVLRSIRIDDTATGNGNGELDAGETASIVLTLENFGVTTNSVSAMLSFASPNTAFSVSSTAQTIAKLESGGVANVTFSIQAKSIAGTTHRRLPLVLKIDTTSATNGDAYHVDRFYTLEYAPIVIGKTQSGLVYTEYGNEQDDYQFWYVSVPPGADFAKFTLECTDKSVCTGTEDVLDILVKKGGPARFDYEAGLFPDAVDDATLVQSGYSNAKTVTANGGAGTYFVAVVVNPRFAGTRKNMLSGPVPISPLSYDLRVATGRYSFPKSNNNFGCSMTKGGDFDPALPILLLLAAWRVWRRRWV